MKQSLDFSGDRHPSGRVRTRAVHNAVAGRVRFRVRGLRGSDALKVAIESRLSTMQAVQSASASVVTGNVLIRFDLRIDHYRIGVLMEAVVADAQQPRATAAESQGRPAPHPVTAPNERWAPRAECDWHTTAKEETLALLDVDPRLGLSTANALERLARYGSNRLADPKTRSQWDILKGQFINFPTALLSAAACVSLMTGGLLDALVIAGVVAANGMIGYWIETKAERTIRSLNNHLKPHARVIRDANVLDLAAHRVVPGDIIVLAAGCGVPADCRVLEASCLSVDESALTGESVPLDKDPHRRIPSESPLAGRMNMVFMGTLVTGGTGLAVAVATGSATEFGRLQWLVGETTPPQTPIERQLNRMGDRLLWACCGICCLVFAIGWLRGQGALHMLKVAVSLAAAALPEALPAAATINFALGVNNMRKHHVLVRRLQAIETIGATATVCLDKTGTLTCNRMSIAAICVDGTRIAVTDGRCAMDGDLLDQPVLHRLLDVCCLCSDVAIRTDGTGAVELDGSSTETALIRVALNAGVDVVRLRAAYRLVSVENRAENRLYMVTIHQAPDGVRPFYAVKGSPGKVLAMCRYRMEGTGPVPFSPVRRKAVEKENQRMAGEAMRVIGVACATAEGSDFQADRDLVWLGLVGMVDPIRESAPELMQVFHRAGIETVMITGDQRPTAEAVARQLGLSKGETPVILDAAKLEALDDEALAALASRVDVYSRVSPRNKLKIVQALQKAGKVVAMTGDGINDSPALKAADIGIAMGKTGTDVAREVADIVLQEDNLETLILAVRDGRTTYDNIRKTLRFLLATNMSEITVMLASMAAGIGQPLTVIQLLWINLISDVFPGLCLCLEGPEGDVLKRPPRDPQAPILDRSDFRRLAVESTAIAAGAMGAYGYGLLRYGRGMRAGSLALQALALGQLLYAVSCRSEHTSIFDGVRRPGNPYFGWVIWGSVALQIATVFIAPLRNLLGIVRPGLVDAVVIAAGSLLPLVVNERSKGSNPNRSGAQSLNTSPATIRSPDTPPSSCCTG